MILEYCNSDIYFDIYNLKEKKNPRERFSLVVVFFFPHQTSLRFATIFEMSDFKVERLWKDEEEMKRQNPFRVQKGAWRRSSVDCFSSLLFVSFTRISVICWH